MTVVQQLLALVHLVGWGTLSGAVSATIIIPLLNRLVARSSWQRTTVAVGWSVLAGLGTVFFAGNWNLADIATTLIAVIGASQAVYHALIRPSGLAARLDARLALAARQTGPDRFDATPVEDPGPAYVQRLPAVDPDRHRSE